MNRYKILSILILVVSMSPYGSYSQSTEPDDQGLEGEPLWEFGMFSGAISWPDYRGSDESQIYAIPFPYLTYRGEKIQAQSNRISSAFLRSNRFEWNISLSGHPPVEDDNSARNGMPDLDPLIEFGPVLKWYFRERDADPKLYLDIKARSVISIGTDDGLDFASEGFHGLVNLVLKKKTFFGDDNWSFGIKTGVDFTDQAYNSYFYDVPARFVTTDRKFFNSDSGYAGFMISSNLARKIGERISLGIYLRWDNIGGAIFNDSPLVKQENNLIIGCALTWKIRESKRRTKIFSE